MALFSFNENSLSRLICNACHKLEVSDGTQFYQVPLNMFVPKTKKSFIAKSADSKNDVVLNYQNIKKVIIDYSVEYSL
ncbi:MAG: hypothetical protein H6536_06375 [Bacteroidales bacterium]|nr:hypothetical protein [Bacteroidales bacterium]